MTTPYNWREHWQPRTRGEFEVVDVRTNSNPGDKPYVFMTCIWNDEGYQPCSHDSLGNFLSGREHGFDLLPIEQPKESE